ncbi:hypothetical protein CISG_08220 [Coccidioides immitis RMSCC 3703]|uniref:Uncharacterized protein n=2 Tax=Coccidioides immitis TaxID=5501 RepID=A0A0J8R857_COCIT|nr:hypothetical protein CIRG_06659 [Coccidioides immitis RMSCC 2394]KMU79938.1 hypothetical protein CISG_08220 [Coccidioides immitis RMSCC 3703]
MTICTQSSMLRRACGDALCEKDSNNYLLKDRDPTKHDQPRPLSFVNRIERPGLKNILHHVDHVNTGATAEDGGGRWSREAEAFRGRHPRLADGEHGSWWILDLTG